MGIFKRAFLSFRMEPELMVYMDDCERTAGSSVS